MSRTICLLVLLISGLLSCNSQRNINKNAVTSEVITNKEWIAVELSNEKIKLPDTNQFPKMKLYEGKISGFSSCNRMNGSYTMEKEKITFGPIAVTKMLCFETQEIEAEFLKLLSEVKFWEYKQGKLHFLNEKKQVIIVFEENR